MFSQIQQYAKFIVAIVGAALTSFSQFIPVEYVDWITAGLAFLTAVSVLAVPNAPTNAQVEQVLNTFSDLYLEPALDPRDNGFGGEAPPVE